MKQSFLQTLSWSPAQWATHGLILIYGPSESLRDASLNLAITQLKMHDPNLIKSYMDNKDHPQLTSLLGSSELFGGKSIYILESPKESLIDSLIKISQTGAQGSYVILSMGDLKPTSPYRKKLEPLEQILTLACYDLSFEQSRNYIKSRSQALGLSLSSDVQNFIAHHINGHPSVIDRELEKLSILATAYGPQALSLARIQVLLAQSQESDLDDWVDALSNRNIAQALKIYDKLGDAMIDPILITQAWMRHLRKLLQVKIDIEEQNKSADQAMKELSPPIFWLKQEAFKKSLNQWTVSQLQKATTHAYHIAQQLRQSHIPAQSFCRTEIIRSLTK